MQDKQDVPKAFLKLPVVERRIQHAAPEASYILIRCLICVVSSFASFRFLVSTGPAISNFLLQFAVGSHMLSKTGSNLDFLFFPCHFVYPDCDAHDVAEPFLVRRVHHNVASKAPISNFGTMGSSGFASVCAERFEILIIAVLTESWEQERKSRKS
jgi:hypothetical protein